MHQHRPPIWMRKAAPEVPTGLASLLQTRGEPTQVAKVLAALRTVREQDSGQDIVSSGRVLSLKIDEDEAELTLRLGGIHCGSAQTLAEMAFDMLRQELPNTDLYLRHEHSGGCPNP